MLRRIAALVFAVCAVAIGLAVRADRTDVRNGDRRGGGGSDASNRTTATG